MMFYLKSKNYKQNCGCVEFLELIVKKQTALSIIHHKIEKRNEKNIIL